MNDDIQLLSLLLRYSQRRMLVSLGLLQLHFVGDPLAARASVARLSRAGLVYVEGPAVRLSLPGFAYAVARAPRTASVHPIRTAASSRAA